MNFSFGFQFENIGVDNSLISDPNDKNLMSNNWKIENKELFNCLEVKVNQSRKCTAHFEPIILNGNTLFVIKSSVDETIRDENGNVCDLIPNRYEGGSTVWECSIDLSSYILQQHKEDVIDNSHSVLELVRI